MIRYLRQILRSSSLRPVLTFYLVATAVVPATVAEMFSVLQAIVLLGVWAVLMILVANARDQQTSTAALNAKVDKVTDLVENVVLNANTPEESP